MQRKSWGFADKATPEQVKPVENGEKPSKCSISEELLVAYQGQRVRWGMGVETGGRVGDEVGTADRCPVMEGPRSHPKRMGLYPVGWRDPGGRCMLKFSFYKDDWSCM